MIVVIAAIISLVLFAYFRNRQAVRNDERRERLWRKQQELMEMLENKKKEDENDAAG